MISPTKAALARQSVGAPTATASLVLLRVSFGLLMLWEVIRFFYHGWVEHLYARAPFHFKYAGFAWVEAWPGDGMHLHFATLGILAVLITLGLFYRVATLLFFLGLATWLPGAFISGNETGYRFRIRPVTARLCGCAPGSPCHSFALSALLRGPGRKLLPRW